MIGPFIAVFWLEGSTQTLYARHPPVWQGVVVGRVSFDEDGDFIDCTKMGVGGKAIPSLVNKITNVTGDAAFILLVRIDIFVSEMG